MGMIKTSNKATAADSKKRNVPHINCHHSQEIWSIGITGAPDRYGLNLRMVKHQNSLKKKAGCAGGIEGEWQTFTSLCSLPQVS
jgi:hypothetical protein